MWKTTFVGLDVSRKTIMATAVDELGHRLEQRKLTAGDPELVEFLARLPGEKKVVLEACNVWEHVYDAAASVGSVNSSHTSSANYPHTRSSRGGASP